MKVISKQVQIALKSATIEFNQEELEFLRDVFNVIGGDPVHSRRRISTRIRDALANVGMNMDPVENTDKEGTIYFLSADDVERRKKTKIKSGKKVLWDSRNDYEDECPF